MKITMPKLVVLSLLSLLAACAGGPEDPTMTADHNPFLEPSPLPLAYPPFDRIVDADFGPAFDVGMAEQRAEIAAIVANPESPTFANTIEAMERSGQVLDRAQTVFGNLASADTNEARQAIERDYAPRFSAHEDSIWLDQGLYRRVKRVAEDPAMATLDPESRRLVARYLEKFVRSGAELAPAAQDRLKSINTELARLQTSFSQMVLAEVNDSAVLVTDEKELEGLPEAWVAAAAAAARDRGLDGKWLIALVNTTGQPATMHLKNRALRQRLHEASMARGSRGNEFDTRAIVAEVARLRAERAALLGFANHAAYVLADNTAKTTAAVNARLGELAPRAVANARREAAEIQALIDAQGGGFEARAWDWDYYTEQLRKTKFDLEEARLKPYLELERVLRDGVFFAAEKLYGIRFRERHDLPVYHPDVRVYDVLEADGRQLAIFLLDPYARPSKRGGAWMNAYVSQSGLLGRSPVIANHLNATRPTDGRPSLMTWDDVVTLFHEFGHALHGMFSAVRYPFFAGTRVPRDYVEYPSQVNEMWATWPEVLKNYARHWQTGEPMPAELLDKVLAAAKFNQGYATTEYLAATIVDQRLHQLAATEVPAAAGLLDFEAAVLREQGLDFPLVPPRYRLPYFSHIMGGYAAGYYSYVWSEVLDADSVEWFKEHGGLTRENGEAFRKAILSRGGSVDAMRMFRDFRGRDADIRPYLERRGLD